jgi:hypothetical protein
MEEKFTVMALYVFSNNVNNFAFLMNISRERLGPTESVIMELRQFGIFVSKTNFGDYKEKHVTVYPNTIRLLIR